MSDFFHLEESFCEKGKMNEAQYDITENKITNQSWEAWRVETAEDDLWRAESLRERCQGRDVLDFGCGNGGFLREIKKYASEAVGVELDYQDRIKMEEEDIKVKASIEDWGTRLLLLLLCFK